MKNKLYALAVSAMIMMCSPVHAEEAQSGSQEVAAQEIAADLALSLENLSSDDKILLESEVLKCINKDKNNHDAEMIALQLEHLRSQYDFFKTMKRVSYICGVAALPVVIFAALIVYKRFVLEEDI